VVGGDAKIQAISAASILAKVHRDRLCDTMDQEFPAYGFDTHKGYPTSAHLQALKDHGPCVWHRTTFGPVQSCLQE